MSDWWLGLAPAEVVVECGGARHRVRWEAGSIAALDHADLEGERALSALGGEPCICADVIDAWHAHAGDERVLVVGRRGPADRIIAREWGADDDEDGHHVFVGGMASMPIPASPNARLLALMSLPGALPDRLQATVAAALVDRAPSPRLHAALYGRVREVLGDVEVELLAPGATPSLGDGCVALPFSWVSSVWARGVATVLGRFCLAAETTDGRVWTLDTATERMRLEIGELAVQ
jgi:hypothetical protein